MKNKYFALLKCDEWKSYDSMRLVGVFTKKCLIREVKSRILSKQFDFDFDLKRLPRLNLNIINNNLTYGFIQELEIDEVL